LGKSAIAYRTQHYQNNIGIIRLGDRSLPFTREKRRRFFGLSLDIALWVVTKAMPVAGCANALSSTTSEKRRRFSGLLLDIANQ